MILQYDEIYRVEIFQDTTECFDLVSKHSKINFNETHENYIMDGGPDWALGNMLKNNKFEGGYYIAYKNDEPIGFAGVRNYSNENEECPPGQILLARAFTAKRMLEPSLYGLIVWAQLKTHGKGMKYITIHDPQWKRTFEFFNKPGLDKRSPLFALAVQNNNLFDDHKTVIFNNVPQLVMCYDKK